MRWPTRDWCWLPEPRRGSGNPSRQHNTPRDTCRWWGWASGVQPARVHRGTPSRASLGLRARSSDPNSDAEHETAPSRISWKVDCQKSNCRTVHGPLVLRRIRTLRTLKGQDVNHYTSHPGIKMRSDQYSAPREHADRGVSGVKAPGLLEEPRSAWARCMYKPI